MQLPLAAHITFLEEKIASLKARLAEPGGTQGECSEFRNEIRLAKLASVHYKKAFELEKAISH